MGDPTAAAGQFAGFPASAQATPVPSAFFTELLPRIESAAELRVTLYAIYALGRHRGYPRFVSGRELAAEAPLLAALGCDGDARPALEAALAAAVERGSLVRVEVELDGRAESLYFLNTPSDRRAAERVQKGEVALGRALPVEALAPAAEQGNVYRLYEENIGPLTPLVAEELKEAEELYPVEWIEEALREAALLNKRSWRYVAAILKRWHTEGRGDEAAGRDPDAGEIIRSRILERFQR